MADRLNTAVAIDELVVNENNARREHDTDPALTASIAAAGLMYPITVKPIAGGKYEVIDGARRLYAIKAGLKSGAIDMERIPVKIIENGLDSLEYSLHGNLHMSMHPLDEAEAIAILSKRDEDKSTIAARFGKTITWVDQRAKLSNLIPKVKELYREGQLDLECAMAFTLADAKTQAAIVKAHQYDNAGIVRRLATQTKVNAKEAIFDLELVPAEKIERDLFSEDVWINSIPLFLKLQGEAFTRKIEEYKAKGYNDVIVIPPGDWQTINKYAAVQGKVSAKSVGLLTCLLQLNEQGKFRVWENMIPNKEASKVKQSAEGPNKTEEAEIVNKTAAELTQLQGEFLCVQASLALVTAIENGQVNSVIREWMLVSATIMQPGDTAPTYVYTAKTGAEAEKRWARVQETHKGLIEADVQMEFNCEYISLPKWLKMPEDKRRKIVATAYASLVRAPYGTPLVSIEGIPVKKWCCPDEAFFSRYRTDQLEDYLHKCGIKPAEHENLKKGDLVRMCVSQAKRPGAWKFGLE